MKPKKHELWILFLISFFLIAVGRIAVAADFSTELIKIESRKGVTQKFILIKPENPELSVIMMPGSNGCLKLSGLFGNISIGSLKRDFLVRNRENIAKQNIMVAVMDASSDKQSKKSSASGCLNSLANGNELFRMSEDHAQDIMAVASYLRKTANVPIWLVGSSMGTISATNGAIRIREGIDGLVLTASKTLSNKKWGPIYKSHPNVIINMELEKITVPTIIIHHKKDNCDSSSPEEVPKIKERLINASKVELLFFSGGKAKSSGCSGKGFHGFNGIDNEVIEAILKFIGSNSK